MPRRRARTIAPLVAVALAALCGDIAAYPLRIGSWNIEHCGRSGVSKDAELMAKYIAASGASLLALQEIYITNDPGPGELRRNNWLDDVARRLGPSWHYALFGTSCSEQQLAVLLDATAVRTKRPRGYFPLNVAPDIRSRYDATVLCRRPVGTYLEAALGKTDFLLVPIHLKSNYGGWETMKEHRGLEALHLVERLDELMPTVGDGSEEDVYIAGDTNMTQADEPAGQVFGENGFIDLNAADQTTWPSDGEYPDAPFDRFLVDEDSDEVRADSFTVHVPGSNKESFLRTASDHYLITFDIEVTADDD